MHVIIEAQTRYPRDGGRFQLDMAYDLERAWPAEWDDFVVEDRVKLEAELDAARRPQDLSREILNWLEKHYAHRLRRAMVKVEGSIVRRNFDAMRGDSPITTTFHRRKGDPYIETD